MSRRVSPLFALLLGVVASVTGCGPSRPFYFFEDGDMSHYKGVATELESPDVEACRLAEVEGAKEPLTLKNTQPTEYWDLTLEEAIQTALSNSKVMRTLGGQVVQVPQALTQQSEIANSIYNPALTETNARFGSEAALSAFDAQFSTSAFWEKNDRPVNLNPNFNPFLSPILEQDTANVNFQLAKTTAYGTQLFTRLNNSYSFDNNPSNRFPSIYNSNVEVEFRHPLLQGGGIQFNRIAGPNAIPGFNNGVLIARINTDVALANFEGGVRDLVSDTEVAYWELYFAYRNLDAVIAGRDSALQTWRKVYAKMVADTEGGEADKEAQAREQYFLFRAQVENSLSSLYSVENRLRYMMGLAATDGRLIRPKDEPTAAHVAFDWTEVHCEALARSPELRRQKWLIKQRELELVASKNYLLPRLDLIGRYRWVGFGDDLIQADASREEQFATAFQTLTDGDFQEWQMGAQMSLPIGFRKELSGVRNAQLGLARERSLLQDQELEVSHQLTDAVRDVDRYYVLCQTNFNRRLAAKKQVEVEETKLEVGTSTLDLLLDAQRRLADAQSQYYRSLVDYNLAIRAVHLRKNSLLEYNNVVLSEGPWPGKAYFDARKRARERDAGLYLNYGSTQPRVMSQGPISQQTGSTTANESSTPITGQPTPAAQPTEEVEEHHEVVPEPKAEKSANNPAPTATRVASAEPRRLDRAANGAQPLAPAAPVGRQTRFEQPTTSRHATDASQAARGVAATAAGR